MVIDPDNRAGRPPTVLGLDEDDLVACVSCGLCLPHCPTYRATGLEIASPRGRITAMRLVEFGGAPIDDSFERAMNECIQCRGCETACPSSVPFGHLMEDARAALATRPTRSWWRRILEAAGYRVVLPRHWLLISLTWVAVGLQFLRAFPKRLGMPRIRARSLRRLRHRALVTAGPDADGWLFVGCVMDAWLRDTHRHVLDVAAAMDQRVAVGAPSGSCCGALHQHAGRRSEAQHLARRVIAAMPCDIPVIVDSAGCGAAMKDYGRLLGTDEARKFAARVVDFSEWVVATGPPATRFTGRSVVVADPCHLRHVQHAHDAVRDVLAPAYELVETDDDGLCCGAGGTYSITQPALARAVRDRKVAAIRAVSGPTAMTVASANPGCAMHLATAGLDTAHPADLLAAALTETDHG